ncbi:MAG: mammalian cell entry protein, partial [Geminicoccaceae bacterium]|nr:mammalian cell entry protein [Geminicoccaceae bacterium]
MLGKPRSAPETAAPEVIDLPEVEVAERRGPSIVWLIPAVAAAIALWLGYTTLQSQGPTVTITFEDAEGLEAGKTKIKYKDVEVG